MKEETIIFAVTVLLCLTSVVSISTGKASFYAPPYVPSDCYGFSDNGTNIISVGDALWDNRNACGRKYKVWCKIVTSKGKVQPCTSVVLGYDVTVVDHCGKCDGATMLLSQEVFSALTSTKLGKIEVDYEESQ